MGKFVFWILLWVMVAIVFMAFQYGGPEETTGIAPNSWQSFSLLGIVILTPIAGLIDLIEHHRSKWVFETI